MDWVTGIVPGCKENFKFCLVIVNRYRKSVRCLPHHKEDKDVVTELSLCNKIIAKCGVLKIMICDRDPKFTSAFLTDLYDIFETNHPQTDGIAERVIQKMEDIIKILCAYGMEYKDHEGYTITGLHFNQKYNWLKNQESTITQENHPYW
ncbi:hypothetical protein O181_015062 [Austropuccinia psidii MF-1]|uniref:Integrase catalytic domain-containing protein n=1 Tax=Austropuccinia psidii MF-1 TaxID=1389203 RepID=A0A9Q3GQF1_9BASI|nr:hypothetical protein [Austropuccinia psidii MF-1]